jgi:acetyl esterase/lipase
MVVSINRRSFLGWLAAGATSVIRPGFAFAQAEAKKQTYTYKAVGQCQIKADVFHASEDATCPVVIWIHGGALIMGDRGGIPLLEKLLKAGYAVVSIDYRLAPETKLPAILEDVQEL